MTFGARAVLPCAKAAARRVLVATVGRLASDRLLAVVAAVMLALVRLGPLRLGQATRALSPPLLKEGLEVETLLYVLPLLRPRGWLMPPSCFCRSRRVLRWRSLRGLELLPPPTLRSSRRPLTRPLRLRLMPSRNLRMSNRWASRWLLPPSEWRPFSFARSSSLV